MTTQTYRQGSGETKRIHALGPTTREDGTPLAPGEVKHYLRFLTYTGPDGSTSQPTVQVVNLVEDANTAEYDGTFDEIIQIDDQAQGLYEIWYRTVDVDDRESKDSPSLILEILGPLVAPEPPTNLVAV